MKYTIEWDKETSAEAKTQTLKIFDRVDDFAGLCREWLLDFERAIAFGTAFDEQGEHRLIFIELKEEDEIVSRFYLSRAAVRNQYPGIKVISSFITHQDLKTRQFFLDEKRLDKLDQALGARWCEPLLERLTDLESAVKIGLRYALDNVGSMNLSVMDPDEIDFVPEKNEEEFMQLRQKQLISMDLEYHDRVSRSGFGEFYRVSC